MVAIDGADVAAAENSQDVAADYTVVYVAGLGLFQHLLHLRQFLEKIWLQSNPWHIHQLLGHDLSSTGVGLYKFVAVP